MEVLEGDAGTPGSNRKLRKLDYGLQLCGELASFGEAIHASKDAHATVEKQKVAIEQERIAYERPERKEDRGERKEESERE